MKGRGWLLGIWKFCSSPLFFPSPKETFYNPSVRYLLSTILLLLLKIVFTLPIPRTNVRSIFSITNRGRLIL
uniref:ORF71a n=1 Tax=Pinus koraiensis TaxID=88728 RepID=A4QM73_PINKO|nr:ORF71a [Pinus koraiensis]